MIPSKNQADVESNNELLPLAPVLMVVVAGLSSAAVVIVILKRSVAVIICCRIGSDNIHDQ